MEEIEGTTALKTKKIRDSSGEEKRRRIPKRED